jgi:hypothetical protein
MANILEVVEKELTTDDVVIKNPTRLIPRPQVPYEPEYVRLNREPIMRDNNVKLQQEASFSSVDNISFNESGDEVIVGAGHIIDNNDFVDYVAEKKTSKYRKETTQTINTTPAINSYILMVFGKMILTGSLNEIEDKVKAIIYGEDNSFDGLSVSVDNIVVLKRMNIKVGIFVEE